MNRLKKYVFILSFLVISFPLFYNDGSKADQSTQWLLSQEEIRQEIKQIQDFQIHSPEFPDTTDWFNTDERVFMHDLRGKVVVLSFWSLGNNESIKLHQKLGQIKGEYGEGVEFIDIQSPFYYHSLDRKWIKDSVKKYKINNPVLFDRNYKVCQAFNVNRFPTFIFIDKSGYHAGYLSGLDKIRYLDAYIQNVLTM